MRTKHNIKSDIPLYIDDSGVCPACGVNLHARAKVITHACETRHRGKHCRVRCRDVILGGTIPRVPNDMFTKLQERDRKLIAAARKAGHTHVRTVRPAERVASAATNRSIARGAKRKWESISSTHAPVSPQSTNKKYKSSLTNVAFDLDIISLLKPPKRLHCKSTVVLARPIKRLKVKTTLPHTVSPIVP